MFCRPLLNVHGCLRILLCYNFSYANTKTIYLLILFYSINLLLATCLKTLAKLVLNYYSFLFLPTFQPKFFFLPFMIKIEFLQKQKFWGQGCFTSSSKGFVCQMLSHIRTERQTILSEKGMRGRNTK